MKRLVDVPRSELNIGDRILAKHLNDAMDDYLFTVEREQADELPTEPWTFVRLFGLDFPAAGALAVMNDAGQWATASWAPKHELNYDRFEVLAEPRAVTVKRVFDRIAELDQQGIAPADVIDRAAAEFGADS